MSLFAVTIVFALNSLNVAYRAMRELSIEGTSDLRPVHGKITSMVVHELDFFFIVRGTKWTLPFPRGGSR